MAGDFNCGDVHWEMFEAGDDHTRGSRLMKVTLDNMMIQWVKENTRIRGEDEPSRLDLIFTKSMDLKDISYMCPLGKSRVGIEKTHPKKPKKPHVHRQFPPVHR